MSDGWIRVEDRLPDEGEYVLAWNARSRRSIRAARDIWGVPHLVMWHNEEWMIEDDITHWQPYPEPPQDV